MKFAIKMSALLLVLVTATAFTADQEKTDLTKMRDQIRVLESVLNQNLTQSFPGPFPYLDAAHGVYLPGYGVVFSFEVNLARPSLGLFESPTAQTDRDRKQEEQKRREQAKAMAEKLIADFGHTMDQLGADDSLAIVIHGSAATDRGLEKTTIVVRAQKRDLDQLRANTLDRAAFLRKLQVLEY